MRMKFILFLSILILSGCHTSNSLKVNPENQLLDRVTSEDLESTEQLVSESNDISDDGFITDRMNCFSQNIDSTIIITRIIFDSLGNAKVDSITQSNLDSICKERGHLLDIVGMTAMYCPPQYIDLLDRTIMIIYDTNIISGFCKRCGRYIKKPAMTKPDTVTVWKKFSY